MKLANLTVRFAGVTGRPALGAALTVAAVGNAVLLRLLRHDLIETRLAGRARAADRRARR
jgi:hypothetical protein